MINLDKSSLLGLCLLALSLGGCTAAYNPPARQANKVAPNVPLLWPEESQKAAPTQISTGAQDAALGVDNGIIAVVANKAITLKEFDVAFFKALKNNTWGISEVEIYNHVLDQMIERELLLLHADSFKDEMAIVIPNERIDHELDRMVKNFPGGWEGYRRMLEDEKLSLEEMRNQIKENMTIKRVQAELMRGMGPPSPREIQKAYQQRYLEWKRPEKRDVSLITVFLGEYRLQPEKGKAIIDNIKAGLKAGEDFAKLAQRYSDGAKSEQGGRQGWVGQEDLAEEITKVAFGMDELSTSGPHRMGELVFFLKCHEVQPEQIQPLNEVRDQLSNQLYRKQRGDLMLKMVKKIKSKTHIQKLSPDDYLQYRRSLTKTQP
jgi:parvulin-like peptidyl-prolyl isomerase